MEVTELSNFISGFLNIPGEQIGDCLTTAARHHHVSEHEVASVALSKIEKERTSCLTFSKDKSLFDYQRSVVERFYSERGTIAAFATGTGKTLTATAAAACVHNMAKVLGRKCNVLVVTPASLVDNMKKEFTSSGYDFGDDLAVISSNIFRDMLLYNKRRREGVPKDADRFMVTNAKRSESFNDLCNQNTFLIVDEAHEFKTDYLFVFEEPDPRKPEPEDVESRAKMFVEECYPRVWKVLLLTATPMLNRWFDAMNLIAAVKGVDPRTQRSKIQITSAAVDVKGTSFGQAVDVDDVPYHQISLTDPDYFRGVITFRDIDRTDPNFPTRLPENYLAVKMPDAYYQEVKRLIESISRKRPSRRQKTDEEIQKELEGLQEKLANLPNNPKIEVVAQILSSGEYDKILIYSRFLAPLRALATELERRIESREIPPFEIFIITGQDVPPAKRHAYLQNINRTPRAVVLVSDAGGIGLDFKALEAVIIYEPGINLSREEQAIGRAVRYKSHILLPREKQRVVINKLIIRFPDYVDKKTTPDQMVALRAQIKDLSSRSFREALVAANLGIVPRPPEVDSSPAR